MTLPKCRRVKKFSTYTIYTHSYTLRDSIQLGLSIEYVLKELSILFVICVISDDKRENVL